MPAPKKNFGDERKLTINRQDQALLRFDFSSIPAGAQIDRASLVLTGGSEDGDECEGDRA